MTHMSWPQATQVTVEKKKNVAQCGSQLFQSLVIAWNSVSVYLRVSILRTPSLILDILKRHTVCSTSKWTVLKINAYPRHFGIWFYLLLQMKESYTQTHSTSYTQIQLKTIMGRKNLSCFILKYYYGAKKLIMLYCQILLFKY